MRYAFAFAKAAPAVLGIAGITPSRSYLDVDEDTLTIHFGPWTLTTPVSNIAEATTTGPYHWWKAIGVRLSVSDRGLTFGSTTEAGTCIAFHTPVTAIDPFHLLRHPSVTVTVADPPALTAHLNGLVAR
ncbi:hypothetical protein [Umezawaea sp. Da 62-37]|uniref:hypothetical protein n=1 Tax=Umezawaea sp. Da 62-37 TaxID=3075927 RepID=UPI0028F708DE|nr:hypothetical protein [Umezawaea sp. Da 62-37]WNV88392.1 hypothetical protein RM788_08880 [Umezawaea sp. Da 62-37]